ncbi:hypothetical protein ABZ805_06420 [Saccharopolyspora sp. NPDC047091]|uniref:hypothetical protein n=1 Tax=Saccharopolyspora sp. NPDC047091 TaxID=3155924 RepID=UPI0033D2B2F5
MSGEERRPDTPQGPPWSLDLVADLHAGALDPETAEQLLPRLREDPEASALLAALDATASDLRGLEDLKEPAPEVPSPAMPADVAARLDDALRAELDAWPADTAPAPEAAGFAASWSGNARPEPATPEPAPVLDLAAARARRRKRVGWTTGLITAAAAVTGIVVLGTSTLGGGSPDGGTPQAGRPEGTPAADGPPPLALRGGDTLPASQLGPALSSEQYGELTDPARLLGCLQANGVTSGNPLGARDVTIDGKPARALVLPGGGIGKFRILIVGQECGPNQAATISDSTLGGR